jgi:hypothetical protein
MMMTKKKKKKKKMFFFFASPRRAWCVRSTWQCKRMEGFEREWTERRTDAVNFQEKVFFFFETLIRSRGDRCPSNGIEWLKRPSEM